MSILPSDKFHALLRAQKTQLPNGHKRHKTFVGTAKPKEIFNSTNVSSLKPGSRISHPIRPFRNSFTTEVSITIGSKHDVTLSELVRNVQSKGTLGEQGWFQYPMVDNSHSREPSVTWELNLVSRLTDNSYYPESFNFALENVGTLPTWNAYTAASIPLTQQQLRHRLRNLWSDRIMTDISPIVQNHEGISIDSMFLRPDITEVPGPTVMNSYNSHGFQTADFLPSRSFPTALSPSMEHEQPSEYGDLVLTREPVAYGDLVLGRIYPVWDLAPYPRGMQIRQDTLRLTDYQRLMQQWVNY